MKLIVTHFSPDLDAVTSVWLIKRFFKDWNEAEVKFVPAGETYENQIVDSDENVIHVDTGLGRFDHHNRDEDECAAGLVLEEIKNQKSKIKNKQSFSLNTIQNSKVQDDKALERLVCVVNDIDHFREVYWPKPTADYYELGLVAMLDGWKILYANEPEKIMELSLSCLDAVYKQFQNKIWAEKLLKEDGREFKTKWGKGIGLETPNDEVVHTGQKQGYTIVVRKDPKKGYVRIKSLPDEKIDLTDWCKKLKTADPEATWFLHINKHMILNGSVKNPKMRPTRLSLEKIIEIIRQ